MEPVPEKKRRGRKAKVDPDSNPVIIEKIPKKRGRKPKGGKIITTNLSNEEILIPEPNIILHLRCGIADLNKEYYTYITI